GGQDPPVQHAPARRPRQLLHSVRHHRWVAVAGVCLVVWAIAYRVLSVPAWRARGRKPSDMWRGLPLSLSIWAGVSMLLASVADTRRPQLMTSYLGVAVTTLLLIRARQLRGLLRDWHGIFSSVPPDAVELLNDPASRAVVDEARRIVGEGSGPDPEFARIVRGMFDRIGAGEADELLREGEVANRFLRRLASGTLIATVAAASVTCGSVIWLFHS
ncbi:MAG: hypothetical protein WKF86_01205, partial [Acidimicrobiales bacterium]